MIVIARMTAAAMSVEPTVAQDEIDQWLVGPNQKPIDRVPGFRPDFSADEQSHQDRHEVTPRSAAKNMENVFV